MLRLQVGDQIAEVTLPTSVRATAIGVQQAFVRRLVAGDVEPDQLSSQAGTSCCSSSARRPVKWPFSKSTSQASPSSSGVRSVPRRTLLLGGDEIDIGQQEPGLDAHHVERARADRRGCRGCDPPPSAHPTARRRAQDRIHSS
jgi:hypothetical protein